LDTDKVLQYIYDNCVEAGPIDCPLHANSSALVQSRVENIFASIKASPLPVIDGTEYDIIDYSRLKFGFFASFYSPFSSLRNYAYVLASLEERDGRPALAFLKRLKQSAKCNRPLLVPFRKEGQLAVLCGEAEGVDNSISGVTHHLEELGKISIFADVLTDLVRIPCALSVFVH